MAASTARGTAAKTARPRRKRDSLSREIIVAAAEAVADRDGLEGLTFQAIGAELDAHPTSVYRHFRDKDELLLELVDTLRARSYGGTLVPSDDWRVDLRLAAKVVHEHYLRYPRFAFQMAARTTRRPVEFSNVEFLLQALVRAGLDDDSVGLYQRAFGNFVRGSASIEAAMLALPEETRRADELAWEVEYRQLDPESFPTVAAHPDALRSLGDPEIFDFSIELLITAIEVRAAELADRRSAPQPASSEES